MKFNWGWGIAIFYTSFVVIMIGMVVYSTQNKVQLVQEEYYNKDLNYEAFRQKRQNADQLNKELQINYIASLEQLELIFPEKMKINEGTLTLFRPSNLYQDQKIRIQTDENNQMTLPTNKLSKGKWKIQLNFESEGKAYYKEEVIAL